MKFLGEMAASAVLLINKVISSNATPPHTSRFSFLRDTLRRCPGGVRYRGKASDYAVDVMNLAARRPAIILGLLSVMRPSAWRKTLLRTNRSASANSAGGLYR